MCVELDTALNKAVPHTAQVFLPFTPFRTGHGACGPDVARRATADADPPSAEKARNRKEKHAGINRIDAVCVFARPDRDFSGTRKMSPKTPTLNLPSHCQINLRGTFTTQHMCMCMCMSTCRMLVYRIKSSCSANYRGWGLSERGRRTHRPSHSAASSDTTGQGRTPRSQGFAQTRMLSMLTFLQRASQLTRCTRRRRRRRTSRLR